MSFKLYEVGGCVRDRILGVDSKDIDFVFVLDDIENKTVEQGWKEMKDYLMKEKFEIFLETESCFTIRARFPKDHKHKGLVADFVMARKEIGYDRGISRAPKVVLGTLHDDLLRRDFTFNAMAVAEDGTLIDPFGGKNDLLLRILKTPRDTRETMLDDPLRLIRAIRFAITKECQLSDELEEFIEDCLYDDEFLNSMDLVSDERIKDELNKCFKFSTIETLAFIDKVFGLQHGLIKDIFKRDLHIKLTNEK